MGVASVPEGDPVFVVKLQDYTATEKDEVTLSCELSKDVPVVWYHSEKELTASKMLLMRSEGTRRALVLKKVERQNEGRYVCDCGTDKTAAAVTVEGKQTKTCRNKFRPSHAKLLKMMIVCVSARDIKIIRPIYGVELFDGETARFEVEISEDDVRGQWKLNGEVLSPSSVSS